MMLVDTHCHLDMPEFEADLEEVIRRAVQAGVKRIIVPGIDLESSIKAVRLAEEHEEIFAAVGIHPHYADKATREDISGIRKLATESDKVVGIGEIGLDNYRKHSPMDKQKFLFAELLDMACQLDLPAVIHSRQAAEETLEAIRSGKKMFMKGVMHCFSEGEYFLKEILSMGLAVSFAGNITFPKAVELRNTARLAGIDNILLETDSPYLSAEKHRGQRNEPSFVGCLTELYGDLFGISPEEAATVTSFNADRIFRLGLRGTGEITYKIRNSLYVNVTHRCTNRCSFCARQTSSKVKGHDLFLGRDPLRSEIISEIGDPRKYDEIVFCGFGEPSLRMGVIKAVSAYVKERGGRTRLNTNGEANLINGRDVTAELSALVDEVSVSLNAPDAQNYEELCSPVFGAKAYASIKEFILGCSSRGIKTSVTSLDSIGEDKVSLCRGLGESLGAAFRLRRLNDVD